MRTLITADWIVTVDDRDRVLEPGWLLVDDARIADLGEGEPPGDLAVNIDRRVDLPGRALMPGITNAHTHLFQTFLRGVADTLALEDWLKQVIWDNAYRLSAENVATAALVGCVENLKSGGTLLIDNHYLHNHPANSDAVLDAIERTGIRGVLARGASDYRPFDPSVSVTAAHALEPAATFFAEMERLMAEWHGRRDRTWLAIGPSTNWTCTDAFAQALGAFARANQLAIHIHIAETRMTVEKARAASNGLRDVQLLHQRGLLNERTHMAHAVWLDADEIKLAADAGATAMHCPVSNMYLASGVMPLPAMRAAGLRIALGTDGPASNNSQDNLEVLKAAACLQKVATLDAGIVTPLEILRYACQAGADAVGLGDRLGSLARGKYADVVAVRLDRAHIGPVHHAESALVFNANGNDVDWVMVGGAVLVEHGRVLAVDEDALMASAQRQIDEFVGRARQRLPVAVR